MHEHDVFLRSAAPRKSIGGRMIVVGIVIFVASVQFTLIFAEYLNVRLPVRLSVSWSSSSSQKPLSIPELDDALARLTDVPTDFKSNDQIATGNYQWHTEAKLRQLTACMARGDCAPNADKIAIFASWHCHWALYDGYRGGEGVWCMGMMRSLERQGFTVLHGGDNDWRRAASHSSINWDVLTPGYIHHLHRQLGHMVKIVVADQGEESHKGTFAQFQKSASRPDGIPAWKWFWMSYYPTGMSSRVGRAWMITAEPRAPDESALQVVPSGSTPYDYSSGPSWFVTGTEELHVRTAKGEADFTFLGYGLMPYPEDTRVVPWSERPNRVYILAKQAHYFHNGHQHVYNFDFFTRAHEELSKEFPGFEFVGGFEDNRSPEDVEKWGKVPSVIKNFGIMNATHFDEEYGKSRLLLGLGSPPLSPSPYRALSRGVPFANPHTMREDGSGWAFQQHESMMGVPEPYAYQVQAFNYTSFVDTIRKALTSPIEPLRFERMRQSVVDQRMHDWVMSDWRGLASDILEDRKAGIETQGGDVGLFEV